MSHNSHDLEEIEELRRQHERLALKGDVAAIADLFSPDAIAFFPGMEPVHGREQIRLALTNLATQAKTEGIATAAYRQDIGETIIQDRYAIQWGLITIKNKSPSTGDEEVRLSGLKVLRKGEDGRWLVHWIMSSLIELRPASSAQGMKG